MKIINKLLSDIALATGQIYEALKTRVYALPPPPLLAVSPGAATTRTQQTFNNKFS